MIDADYYINLTPEEFLKITESTEILPIDDKMSYDGHIYQLTNFDMQVLNLTRNTLGYPNEYSGPEKNKGDAYRINMMDLNKVESFAKSIQHEIDNGFEPTKKTDKIINRKRRNDRCQLLLKLKG